MQDWASSPRLSGSERRVLDSRQGSTLLGMPSALGIRDRIIPRTKLLLLRGINAVMTTSTDWDQAGD